MSKLAREAMSKPPARAEEAIGAAVSVCNYLRRQQTDEALAMQLRLSRALGFFIEATRDAAELSIPKYEYPVHVQWDGLVGVN